MAPRYKAPEDRTYREPTTDTHVGSTSATIIWQCQGADSDEKLTGQVGSHDQYISIVSSFGKYAGLIRHFHAQIMELSQTYQWEAVHTDSSIDVP